MITVSLYFNSSDHVIAVTSPIDEVDFMIIEFLSPLNLGVLFLWRQALI